MSKKFKSKIKKVSPQSVSRILRGCGMGVVSTRSQEGLMVSRSVEGAVVTAQFESIETASRHACEAMEALKFLGFNARRSEQIVFVTASK